MHFKADAVSSTARFNCVVRFVKDIDINWKGDEKLKSKAQNLLFVLNELNSAELRLNLNGIPKSCSVYSFYDICRINVYQKLHYLISEEFMDNHNRNQIDGLIRELYDGNDELFYKEFNCIIYFLTNNFNEIDQGNMMDYSISIWSGFEYSINIIFDKYFSDNILEFELKNINKIRTIIKKIFNDKSNRDLYIDEIIDNNMDYINRELPCYLTSDDKINTIFKKIKANYKRDINQDKQIMQLFRSVRNSLHNNGVHKSGDVSVEIMGERFELKKDHICHLNSDSSSIKITSELINIFSEIIISLSKTFKVKIYEL